MIKSWHDKAWEEYQQWQTRDKIALKRINKIIKDIDRSPFEGIGKPEPLKGNLSFSNVAHITVSNPGYSIPS